jgi:hypothetical protein
MPIMLHLIPVILCSIATTYAAPLEARGKQETNRCPKGLNRQAIRCVGRGPRTIESLRAELGSSILPLKQ